MGKNKFIVVIGSSEGGLKPTITFFDITPNDHATYIILNHLPPDYKSELQSILKRHSKLEVMEAKNDMMIEENKVYTQPSFSYMTIHKGKLHLQSRQEFPLFPNWSVDIFLKSLAVEKGNYAIAVILSGGGTDGTEGSLAIKQAGGLVLAQEPQTCAESSMPTSIINTGAVDYQLNPEQMPGIILTYINNRIKQNHT